MGYERIKKIFYVSIMGMLMTSTVPAVELESEYNSEEYYLSSGVSDGELEDKDSEYLTPNEYVWYEENSPAVIRARNETHGMNESQAFEKIKEIMKNEFSYDFEKAEEIKSEVIHEPWMPDVQSCYEQRKGICQDLAAVTVCMLRTVGIRSELVIGYADGNYHAWTESWVDGKKVLYDPTGAIMGFNIDNYETERFY